MQRAARSPARSHRDPRRGHRRAGRRTLWLRHLRSCRRPSRLTMSGWRPRRFRPAGSSQASCAISSSTARSSARSFVQGAVTVPVATLQIPGTFVTALQSGDLLKAIGAAAASVTGAADAAATPAIISDGTIVAPRALNAFEVGVVGLVKHRPCRRRRAAGSRHSHRHRPPGHLHRAQPAGRGQSHANRRATRSRAGRRDGRDQCGCGGHIPALNDILLGGFQSVDAAAQTLARTGDPAKAVAAGAATVTWALHEAGSVVADSVVTAVSNIRREIDQSRPRAASPINKVQRSPRQQHRLAPG